jgi:hypothetical protein
MTSLQQTAMLGGAANAKVASYVLVAADAGDAITMSNAGATTITVNTGLFAAGDIVTIINIGAGACTITAGTATVTTSGSLVLAQNQGGVLRFTSASAAIFLQFATPASGDIEGVTAGTGISGGGTSGTVTITNSMATEIAAKGDLIVGTGSATFDNLTVGANDTVLTADSSTATGLKWATPSGGSNTFYAGKNKIMNGDFSINQRAFTSTTTNEAYGFDRWKMGSVNGTTTYSTQTFTPGTAPVSGYEGTNFARLVTTGQDVNSLGLLYQFIENARTFAGQTVTVSFWAKAGSGTPQIATNFLRNYGSGGSPTSQEYTNTGVKTTISTSWARYSVTIAVPSVAGKTFGTTANTSSLALYLFVSDSLTPGSNSLGAQNNTFDIWGVQVEAGSTATDFQTASGSIAGELALCQRYFANVVPSTADYGTVISMFQAASSSTAKGGIRFPVPMRISASITLAAANNFTLANASYSPIGGSSFTYALGNTIDCRIDMSVASGLVAGDATALSGNTANLLIQASAEF